MFWRLFYVEISTRRWTYRFSPALLLLIYGGALYTWLAG